MVRRRVGEALRKFLVGPLPRRPHEWPRGECAALAVAALVAPEGLLLLAADELLERYRAVVAAGEAGVVDVSS